MECHVVIAENTKLVVQHQKTKEMKPINVWIRRKEPKQTVIREKNVHSLLTCYKNTTGAAALMVVEESFSVLI